MTREFDDPQIESMLGAASGAYPDANVAYEAVRGRVRQAKRRRALVAGTAACALLFGTAALAATGGTSGNSLQPSGSFDDDSSSTPGSATGATESTDDATESTADESSSSVATSDATGSSVDGSSTSVDGDGSGSGDGGSGGSNSGSGSGNSGQSGSGNGGPGSTNSGSGSSSSTPTTDSTEPTVPDTGPQVFSSIGGSITVAVVDGRLQLVGVSPATGFTKAGEQVGSDRVRVEFAKGEQTVRVEVRAENGRLVQTEP